MSDHASTQELISNIEKKDRRFRLFQTFFMIGTFVALIFIIGAQQRTLSNVQAQVDKQDQTAAEARQQRNDQLEAITRRLDCMVVFFSQPDRDNLTIENVENCALNRDQDLNKFFQNEPNNSSENPPNLQDSATSATQENDAAQGSASSDTTTEDSTPRPKYIFGVPICVPFTQICVEVDNE